MILSSFTETIQKISDFGNEIFNKTVGFLGKLPGVACGLASLLLLALAAIGVLSLLKKSFKVFGIILLVVIVVIFGTSFLK